MDLSDIQETTTCNPPIQLIYGPPGSWKTQYGLDAPKPIFLCSEMGFGDRKAKAVNLNKTIEVDVITDPDKPPVKTKMVGYALLNYWLGKLFTDTSGAFETIVIDSLDHVVPMVVAQVLADKSTPDKPVKSIEDFGWGKGQTYEEAEWIKLISRLVKLSERGYNIILLAHASDRTIQDPTRMDPYHRIEPKLPKKVTAYVQEKCNIIGLAHQQISIVENDAKQDRAIGRNIFDLQVSPTAAIVAKNQYRLPDVFKNYSYAAVSAAIHKAIHKDSK